jgi:hypothetical protein
MTSGAVFPWEEEAARVQKAIDEAARAEANRRAPEPSCAPIAGGLFGSVIAYVVIMVFSMIAGLSPDHFDVALGVTLVGAFLVPYAWLKYQQRQHHKAYAETYMRLRRERTPPDEAS